MFGNPFASEIIDVAKSYVNTSDICYETSANKGNCITDLKCYFDGKYDLCSNKDITDEAYCAIGSWVWVDKACQKFGMKNYLPKTKGALDMLNRAKSNGMLRVDREPAPGATFYRKSGASGSTGHIGIVDYLSGDYFHTVEANMAFNYNGKDYEGVWIQKYPFSDIDKRNFWFIHTEETPGYEKAYFSSNNFLNLLILAGVGYGIYKYLLK